MIGRKEKLEHQPNHMLMISKNSAHHQIEEMRNRESKCKKKSKELG